MEWSYTTSNPSRVTIELSEGKLNHSLDSTFGENHRQELEQKLYSESPRRQETIANRNFFARRDTEAQGLHISILRATKIFPIFENQALAKFSVNYFLYLEFYYTAIRFVCFIFLSSALFYAGYIIAIMYFITDRSKDMDAFLNGITYVYTVFVLTYLQSREEKRVLKSPVIYEYQWTENLFSLFSEGFPPNVTKEEIKDYFNKILAEKKVHGEVRNIIFLQDYSTYNKIKKEIVNIDNTLLNLEQTNFRHKIRMDKLIIKRQTLESSLETIRTQLLNYECFNGKVIIIFNFIEAKVKLEKLFKVGMLRRTSIFLFKRYFKDYYFKGNRIDIRSLPEPQDLIFENLHYSRVNRRLRTVLAYFLGFLIIIVITAVFAAHRYYEQFLADAQVVNQSMQIDDTLFSVGIIILSVISDFIYGYTVNLLAFTSTKEIRLTFVNFSIYMTILLYIISPYANSSLQPAKLSTQMTTICALYSIKLVIIKAIGILAVAGRRRIPPSKGTMNSILQYLNDLYADFDFVLNIDQGIPMVFIVFAFPTLNPFKLLPVIAVALYVFAIVDKIKMIKYSNLFTSKSASYMLRPFKVYRWITILISWSGAGGFYIHCLTHKLDISTGSYIFNTWFAGVLPLVVIASSFYWPIPIDVQVRDNFNARHAWTPYDSVSRNFSSLFRKMDPYLNLKKDLFQDSATISSVGSAYEGY